MKNQEKEVIMEAFKDNQMQILVSTTVIEVGVNVPNATVMLIMDADRFGLAQLHQLRGRVGRGSDASYCILVANPKNELGVERMKIMTETTNGFVLSEKIWNYVVLVKYLASVNLVCLNLRLLTW